MPADLMEDIYCSQQILIPPKLPTILKKYAKAVIRTQPRDLLLWSLHYFKAVADGLPPPVKNQIEYPLVETESGLTPGFLKVLLTQIGNVNTVSKEIIIERWEGICLERQYAELLFKIGNFHDQVEWIKFVALAAGTIEKSLTGTMSLLCEVLTEEPEGGSGIIPVDTFMKLYKYLAALDCGPDPTPPKTSGDGIHSDTLEYSEAKPGEESEVWDTLLKGIGEQKSVLSVATDDMREVDSRAGLAVWPDIVPKDLKLDKEPSTDSLDEVNSYTGVPVWNEKDLQGAIGETELIEQGADEIIEEMGGEQSSENDEKTASLASLTQSTEPVEINGKSESKDEETEKNAQRDAKEEGGGGEEVSTPQTSDAQAGEESQQLKEVEDKSAISKNGEELENEEAGSELTEAGENIPKVETLIEPNSEMIMVPSPHESSGSLCSDERSIKSLDDDKDPSTGQALDFTTSIPDLKINILEENKQELLAAGRNTANVHFAHIPGIGPPVPLKVVEEVEVFLRHCATKQCGMVMPRNLRHFLCPSLDAVDAELLEWNCDENCESESFETLPSEVHIPVCDYI